jgi:phosphomannomutase/phosphoglucomutase
MKIINPLIFKEYDIRGIVAEHMPDNVVIAIGKAVGTTLARAGKKNVNIGRDCRLTSERLFERLTEGILSTGVTVRDVGMCTSPMLYFSIYHCDADGGIMITGSHNPSEYNGFKICVGKNTIHGEAIQALRTMIERDDFDSGKGRLIRECVADAYKDYLAVQCPLRKKIKVVIDAGNGTGGVFAVPIFERMGCDVVPLFCEVDGRFPNHHPDPTVPENLVALQEKVRSEKADLGIAYDGDGDRIGAVDEKGAIVYGDALMILFAEEILSRKPGAVFIAEVKCSRNLYNEITRMGGKPIMWKTGHSLIKAKMKETRAELAGELSGHMFFKDRYFGFDDAIYASCRLLEILAKSDQTFSTMLARIPRTYATPEIRRDCPDTKKFKVVEKAIDYFKKNDYDVIDVDGARVTFEGGWGLVRASNTQPSLVLRFEADSAESLQKIKEDFTGKIDQFIREVA